MGTRGRVPKVNVTSTNIRYVADVDFSLGQGMVTSDQLFQDDDVRGTYIDPEYCAGETDNDRLTTFQDKSLHSGEWRNYGGEDEPVAGIPEIYFKNIIGKGYEDGNLIEFVPDLPEDLQYLIDEELILSTAVPPNLNIIDNYVSDIIINSKMLADATQSAMLNDENINDVLNVSDLAIRVGLDYPNGQSTKDAIFSYSIEVYYGDIPRELQVEDPVTKVKKTKRTLSISFFVGASATIGYIKGRYAAAHFWNYLKPKILKPTWTKIKDGWGVVENFAGTSTGATLLPILAALASYTAMIIVANIIWNMVTNATKVVDGIFQYKNLIDGMYTWDDVKKSKYQIGMGSRFTGNDNFVSKFISATKDQNIHTAAMNSVVYPPTVQFPGSLLGAQKFANFKFFPKCNQYDLMTPPPVITYKIELEAISGCVLSTTKPTAFVVSIAPDKYQAPVFDVITPRGRSSVSRQDVYINDPIIFQNAKYVDFLAMLDLEKNSNFLGIFPVYHNLFINTDGGEGARYNIPIAVTENDIVTTGGNAFGGIVLIGGGAPEARLPLYPEQSTYDATFMQESQGNIIKNSTFRSEQLSSDPSDPTYLLKKYWNYDASWEIRDGAMYRDTTSNLLNGIWQIVPLFAEVHTSRGKYYFLDIDCTVDQSYLAIDLSGTFAINLYDWLYNDPNNTFGIAYYRDPLDQSLYPYGISIVGSQLRISITGKYKLLLRVSNPSNNTLKIIPEYGYTGRINYLSLQYMPIWPVKNSDRGAINALTKYKQPRLQVRWMDAVISSKSITLNINVGMAPTIYIKFRPLQSEYQYYTITIDWGDGGSPTVYSNLIYQEYVEFKNYFWPGNKTMTITCTIPGTGYSLKNLFESFSCNEIELVKYSDNGGLLANGALDLSDSNVGLHRNMLQLGYMATESFLTSLSTLDISNTPMTGNCDKLHIVTNYLDISRTQITGDITSLFDIAYVNASNTFVTICSGSTIMTGANGNKTIIWKDCGMTVDQLYNLVRAIDLSSLESGYLDIKGDNPAIVDQITLDRITMLTTLLGQPDGLGGIGRGWIILYNVISIITIINGTGSGSYKSGYIIPITAIVPDGSYFVNWTDVNNILSSKIIENPTMLIPYINSTVTANILPYRIFTVTNGTGSGSYKEGVTIQITATVPIGSYLEDWTDTSNILSSKVIENPTALIPASNAIVTANILPYLSLIINGGTISIPPEFANIKYGALYNSKAALDPRNITSAGWNFPTYLESRDLIVYLGDDYLAGGKLKEIGIINWQSPNVGATNEVGFNARGAGRRSGTTGSFADLLAKVYFYSGSWNSYQWSYYSFNNNDSSVMSGVGNNFSRNGYSIRIFRFATTSELLLTDGAACSPYIGNDGKIYPTVKIGTQVWIAANLNETKYRDGSLIPIITDNATWIVLTTDAMCAYNNDWINV